MTDNTQTQSRKEWRKLVKKLRRKRIRQKAAIERETNVLVEEAGSDESSEDEEEIAARHRKWLEDEQEANRKFLDAQNLKKAQEAEKQAHQERIRKEWEAVRKQKIEKQREEEENAKKISIKIESFVAGDGPPPEEMMIMKESNPTKQVCPFFSKVAACRFGSSCSRNHIIPSLSTTLLIPGFYSHFTLYQSRSAEYDTDIGLEFTDDERDKDFSEFFDDISNELGKYGEIHVLLVCKNSAPHLRGNVYVTYSDNRQALIAARSLNARWYAGRQLTVNFVNVPDWGSAICGDFLKHRCPKGNECNFLHTFRNPHRRFLPRRKEIVKLRDEPSSRWRWSESPERRDRPSETDRERKRRHSRERRSNSRNHSRSNGRDSSRSNSREIKHRSRRKDSEYRERNTDERKKSHSERREHEKKYK